MAKYWEVSAILVLALFLQVFAQQRRAMGGWFDAKENDKGSQEALKFAQEEFNRLSEHEYITKIQKIIKVKQQVVSGMNYAIEFDATVSPCNPAALDNNQCQEANEQRKRCSVLVYIVPWKNYKELKNVSCR
ncbi:cystatin-like [Gastrophryne carolinensis]